MHKRVAVAALAITGYGCGVLAPYQKGTSGAEYCPELARKASGRADSDFRWAVGLGIAGVASAGTASVMASTIHHPTFTDRFTEGVLPISSAILIVISEVLFSRAKAASQLAAAGTRNSSLAHSDSEILSQCLDAKATWEGSRDDSAAIAQKAIHTSPPTATDKLAADTLVASTDSSENATQAKAEADKAAADSAVADKVAADKHTAVNAAKAKVDKDPTVGNKEEYAKAKADADKADADKEAKAKIAADKQAAADAAKAKANAAKAAADQAAADKAAADKAAADKAAAVKP